MLSWSSNSQSIGSSAPLGDGRFPKRLSHVSGPHLFHRTWGCGQGLLGLLVEALAQTVTLAGLWNAPEPKHSVRYTQRKGQESGIPFCTFPYMGVHDREDLQIHPNTNSGFGAYSVPTILSRSPGPVVNHGSLAAQGHVTWVGVTGVG